MSYKIELTNNFKKEAKKLIKKYASLPLEIAGLNNRKDAEYAKLEPSSFTKKNLTKICNKN